MKALLQKLGIELGRRNIRVPQQFLKHFEIGAVFKQMCCKRMPQGLRCDFCGDLSLLLVFSQDLPESLAAESVPIQVEKEGRAGILRAEDAARSSEILREILRSCGIEGHHPFTTRCSFSAKSDKSDAEIDIFHIQL